jgi:hypothetical protein
LIALRNVAELTLIERVTWVALNDLIKKLNQNSKITAQRCHINSLKLIDLINLMEIIFLKIKILNTKIH